MKTQHAAATARRKSSHAKRGRAFAALFFLLRKFTTTLPFGSCTGQPPRLNQTSTAQLDLFLNPTAQETTPGKLWCTFGPDQLFQCVCRSRDLRERKRVRIVCSAVFCSASTASPT